MAIRSAGPHEEALRASRVPSFVRWPWSGCGTSIGDVLRSTVDVAGLGGGHSGNCGQDLALCCVQQREAWCSRATEAGTAQVGCAHARTFGVPRSSALRCGGFRDTPHRSAALRPAAHTQLAHCVSFGALSLPRHPPPVPRAFSGGSSQPGLSLLQTKDSGVLHVAHPPAGRDPDQPRVGGHRTHADVHEPIPRRAGLGSPEYAPRDAPLARPSVG